MCRDMQQRRLFKWICWFAVAMGGYKALRGLCLNTSSAFTHSNFYTKRFYTQMRFQKKHLHTETFARKSFYTEKSLHKWAFTQTTLHTEACTHKRFYTQTLLHRQNFLHKEAFPQSDFYTLHPFMWKGCLWRWKIAALRQFLIFGHDIGRKGLRRASDVDNFHLCSGFWRLAIIRTPFPEDRKKREEGRQAPEP